MTKANDLTGQVFGRLTALRLGTPLGKRRTYICSCTCGGEKLVRSECLASGMTKSCGCIRVETIAALNKTHGMATSSEYKSWAHAKDRVSNPVCPKFPRYGGRGITMCAEWLNSFDAFYADMGCKPSAKHSVGRIDNDLGYCKENCRWESALEQARARSDNVYVTYNGVKLILKDACRMANIDYKQASRKLKNGSWNAKELFA